MWGCGHSLGTLWMRGLGMGRKSWGLAPTQLLGQTILQASGDRGTLRLRTGPGRLGTGGNLRHDRRGPNTTHLSGP